MACCESGDVMNKVSMMKLQDDELNLDKPLQEYQQNPSNNEKESRDIALGGGAGSYSVPYYENPTGVHPYRKKMHTEYAEFAIDVYNKTHLKKYSFVKLVFVYGETLAGLELDMIFTAKNADDENHETFRARASVVARCVMYVELVPPADLDNNGLPKVRNGKPEKMEKLKLEEASVWYDGDPARCDCEKMEIVKRANNLALEVYNKTHMEKYILVKLLNATGGHLLSGGSMVDLAFMCEPKYEYEYNREYKAKNEEYKPHKTFRARVSVTHSYVKFVEIVPPHLP